MTRKRRDMGPLIPLYLAFAPETLLLARMVYYPRDRRRAAELVEATRLKLLAAPLFRLLVSPECPWSQADTAPVEVREWVRQQDAALVPLFERVLEIPTAAVELVVFTDCLQMLEQGQLYVRDNRVVAPQWQRDLERNLEEHTLQLADGAT